MGEVSIVTPLHKSTGREYLSRMQDEKVACMRVSRKYGEEYWDGDRRYGYGGYQYIPDRWKPAAESLIKRYHLTNDSKVLDIGCGKAYLLYEITRILPGLTIRGYDISAYAIEHAKEEIREHLFVHRAEEPTDFADKEFDLAISINTLHNLTVNALKSALQEMSRISKNQYLCVESYRDEEELFNLQCWALTAESFFRPEEWTWLFNEWGYKGDYEFVYFE